MHARSHLWWRSVRMRTAVASTLALAPALTLVSVAGVLYQRDQLQEGVARVAEEQARSIDATGSSPESSIPPGGESTFFQVIEANGEVVTASSALRGEPALFKPAEVPETTRRTVTGIVEEESDRYLAVAVPAAGNRVVVAVQSLESVDTTTSSTVGLLAVGDPLLVLLVAVLSYVLVGRALRPVESLRAEAAEITAADLAARLPVPPTRDEIERLSITLNDMLARLQVSADAQSRFVADASHELRSPVATIRTLHEVAASDQQVDWPTVSAEVLTETARLERLVADLLLLARSGSATSPEHELLDLSEVVRGEIARARHIPLESNLAHNVLVVGHADSLARATRNLLDNAERHARSLLAVSLSVVDDRAEIRVRDDGHGVARADRARIFDRFVRLDEARARDHGGSGLGLAITRLLVEEQGGIISVAAAPEGGAVFIITLPLAPSRFT